jgi:hypothetical protein
MSVASYQFLPERGYLGDPPNKVLQEYMIINDKVEKIHDVVVHKFVMGDVEDPDLYAAQPLWEWQESEMGKWVMTHAMESPVWHRHPDTMQYGYQYTITAKLRGRDHTFWQLKWGTKP